MMNTIKSAKAGAIALLLSLLLAVALAVPMYAQDASGDPDPATVVNVTPVTLLATRVITVDQVTAGQNTSRWNSIDLFSSVTVASGGALTTTLQFSADGVRWANAYWYSVNSTGTVSSNMYRFIQTSDGTNYLRVPLAGQYVRLDLDVTGTVTPTLVGVFKNN